MRIALLVTSVLICPILPGGHGISVPRLPTEKTPVWETHESTTEALSTSEGAEIIRIFQCFQRFSAFQWFLGRHSSCSANQGPPSIAEWRDLHLNHIRPDEARRVFEQVLPNSDFKVTIDGLSHFATASEHAQAADILRGIDMPSMTPQTRFLRLHHAKADDVVRMLRILFKVSISNGVFEAIADSRTNRIFMMGTPKRQAVAASVVTFLDR
jgi:hypothetical protein